MYSKIANNYIVHLPPMMARVVKRCLAYPRHLFCLMMGRAGFWKYRDCHQAGILFIAGLPKSGTTWLENMLSGFRGYYPITPHQAIRHEMRWKSSLEYDIPEGVFQSLKKGYHVLKMHSWSSDHNTRLLQKHKIRYCVMIRDIRDAAVSHCFYVRRTPWHPEHPEYRRRNIQDALKHFCATRLGEWVRWTENWVNRRDREMSLLVRYENLLQDTSGCLKRIVDHFGIQVDSDEMQNVISGNSFYRMQKKSSLPVSQNFFRRGKTGDWKNHFNEEIRDLFKGIAGNLIIGLHYEEDENW